MTILNNAKISTKIIGLLLALGAVTLFIAWNGSRRLQDTNTRYGEVVNVTLKSNMLFARVNRTVTQMVYSGYQAASYGEGSRVALAAQAEELDGYGKSIKRLGTIAEIEPRLAPTVNDYRERVEKLHALTGTAIRQALRGRDDEAKRLLADADGPASQLIEASVKLQDERTEAAEKTNTALSSEVASTSTFMLALGVLGVVGGIAVSLLVTRTGITGPLSRLGGQMGEIAGGDYAREVEGADRGDEVGAMARAVRVFRENGIAKDAADAAKTRADAEQKQVVATVSEQLSALSQGDLTATIQAEFPGEYAALKGNFNEALERLRELIGQVGESAATIRTGSGEIAQASEDLARRTESNAASLEETAASVTQMDGRLKASAVAASRTVERADQAIATVGGGRAVADEAVQAMGRVSESAKGIDSVIEGLDKIAFQTRVLAMNAAVEAGRAGDAGRGFAVVADLVSALAMRAEEEAKRARDQLTVTQTDIVTAVEAVQKVDGALADISGDVGQVHELLATMAADNQAQSAAITQISAAIGTMDQATQQNAAMVEETSAAARNLASEVGSLAEQAGRFNTGTGNSHTRAPARKPAAFNAPVRPLPAAAIPQLVRSGADDDDWKAF